MRVLHGLEALPDPGREAGRVLTVGVFDGVHLGHFVVLRRVVERASQERQEPVVVTFAGHPKELLTGHAPPTVTSLDHRLLLFERIGIRTTLVLRFTPELRELTAEQFLQRVLLDGMGARTLVLGWDSKFGKDRRGTAESLQPLARAAGFDLEAIGPLLLQGHPVSSTAVREAVALGEFERAATMLGRPVSLLGTVVHGDSRGRELGFPTANLDLHHELRPPDGVYAALALQRADLQQQLRPAVVNIGTRPTFGAAAIAVEVHLLDFQGDLYGQDLELFFLCRIRDERRFPGVEALVAQIHADIAAARGVLAEAPRRWRIPGRYLPIEGPGPESLQAGPLS